VGLIECRVTVTLPPDASGRGPSPGETVWVDDEEEQVDRWIRLSFLVPVVRLPMPDELVPAAARRKRVEGSQSDAGASGDDPPVDASGAPEDGQDGLP
jgi:hypothetical protein